MTNKEAVAKLQAAGDIAIAAGCELAKIPAMDVLAIADLLKEQEAVPVEWQGIPLCGACKAAFLNLRPQKYCHECGRKVKWDA